MSWQENDRNGFAYRQRVTRPRTCSIRNSALLPSSIAAPTSLRYTTAKDVSVFVSDRLWLNDQWSVTAGLRQAYYEVDQTATNTIATSSLQRRARSPAGVTCRTSLQHRLPHAAGRRDLRAGRRPDYYVSYSSSAKPAGRVGRQWRHDRGTAAPGGTWHPGSRSGREHQHRSRRAASRLFDDRLQLQGAIFQTKKDNAKEFDPITNAIVTSGDSQELTGIELGLAGMITDEWSVNANFTWLDAEDHGHHDHLHPFGA